MAAELPTDFYRRYSDTRTGLISCELSWFAEHTLERAKIVQNLDDAIVLGRVINHLIATKHNHDDWSHLSVMQARLYDYVTDDALMVSALETYAKGYLASRGYVVHRIKNPRALKEAQRSGPVLINDLGGEINERLSSETLSCAQLLSGDYPKEINIPEEHLPKL